MLQDFYRLDRALGTNYSDWINTQHMVCLVELQVKAEEDVKEILQLQPRNRHLSYLI